MESLKMDYDLTSIPAVYDRGRDHGPKVVTLWMSVIESHVDGGSVSTILDLGCGTWRFSEGLAGRCVESQIVTQTIAPSWAAYADKLSAGGDSVLARLAEDERARGLEGVRRCGDGPGGRPVVEPIDVLFFR